MSNKVILFGEQFLLSFFVVNNIHFLLSYILYLDHSKLIVYYGMLYCISIPDMRISLMNKIDSFSWCFVWSPALNFIYHLDLTGREKVLLFHPVSLIARHVVDQTFGRDRTKLDR